MARCGCGGNRCACTVVAGEGVTVGGTGTTTDPWVIGTDPAAALVVGDGDCITLTGDGTDEAPLTAAPVLDPDPGNALVCGPDGLLVAGGTGGTVATDCGLTGDGTAGAPLAAATSEWAYDCPIDDAAGAVYCDASGVLRGEPPSQATYVQDSLNQMYEETPVPPDSPGVPVEVRTLEIVNPDPCRPAFVICEVEVDVDFLLPADSGAGYGISTDEMYYTANRGTTAIVDAHVQTTKVYHREIPPGGTLSEPLQIIMSRGTGGATYNRIQSFMRAFVFNL